MESFVINQIDEAQTSSPRKTIAYWLIENVPEHEVICVDWFEKSRSQKGGRGQSVSPPDRFRRVEARKESQ